MIYPMFRLGEKEYLFIVPVGGSSRTTGGALCTIESLKSNQGADLFLWWTGRITDKSGKHAGHRSELKFVRTRSIIDLEPTEDELAAVDATLFWTHSEDNWEYHPVRLGGGVL